MNPGAIEGALNKLNNLMWGISHKYGKGIVGVDIEDLVQECKIKLLDLMGTHGDLPETEFSAFFARACINHIHDLRRKQRPSDVCVDLEEVSYMLGESDFQEIFLKHYQEHLASIVSPDAALLLNELLDPSEELEAVLFKRNLRKCHIQALGIKTSISNRITHELAGEVLGFSSSKTKNLIRQLQQACIDHLGIQPWTCRQLPTVA